MIIGINYHSDVLQEQWKSLSQTISRPNEEISLSGVDLEVSQVASISRYAAKCGISESALRALEASCEALQRRLDHGDIIYGVNTGYGGSADVRTKETERLQHTLTRELGYGVLPPGVRDQRVDSLPSTIRAFGYDLSREVSAQYIPSTWVRAAILIRINSLLKGYSAVRPVLVQRLHDLLAHSITPMIPLRGSISASGDLNPLAYIAGTIMGKPTIRVLSRKNEATDLYADDALRTSNLKPITLKAKEGLAIVNGTAISAGAAALALHDAHSLAFLAQLLAAMSVEALLGSTESFHPYLGETRPHPGQIESARNILRFLEGSSLAQVSDGTDGSLRQDRYSIRTASQWLGPALEDLVLAHQQITIECNSATDNPLIDLQGNALHGGNFQAKAVTAAMEKTRQAMQTIGRMLFVQCTEIINPTTSRGLPPNLVAEDASTSGIFKGTDIHIAALQSELGFLSMPVNHVQTAEMGNQALNSLAFISARYTHTSIEVLAELAAAHLIAVCQALDLRAMHIQYLESYHSTFSAVIERVFHDQLPNNDSATASGDVDKALWPRLSPAMQATGHLDASNRFPAIAKIMQHHFMDLEVFKTLEKPLQASESLRDSLIHSLRESWELHRDAYVLHGDARSILGKGAVKMYDFLRHTLQVPFLCTLRIRTPDPRGTLNGEAIGGHRPAPTVGTYTSTVYRAIRDGTIVKVMNEILEEALAGDRARTAQPEPNHTSKTASNELG